MCSLTEYIGLHSSVVHGVGVRCYTNALAYIHAYTHTHIHTYTHTHTGTCQARSLSRSRSVPCMHTQGRVYMAQGHVFKDMGHVFIARERHLKKTKHLCTLAEMSTEREREREREREEREI